VSEPILETVSEHVEPLFVDEPSVSNMLSEETDIAPSEVLRIPEQAFYALMATIAKHRGLKHKYRGAPTAETCGAAQYRFAVRTLNGVMMVQMVHTPDYARMVALPSEINHARQLSDTAHRVAEIARRELETEQTTAAPILAQTEELSDWKDGDYSAGQKRTSVAQKEMIEGRLARARDKAEATKEHADALAAEVAKLVEEQTHRAVIQKVFTLEQIEQGAILPVFRKPKVVPDSEV